MSTAEELDLPQTARVLCRLLGIGQAFKVVEKFGGSPMYVPIEMTADHPLAQLLGLDDAKKVSREFPGQHVKVEKCTKLFRRQRDDRIRAAFADGTSALKLSREYKIDIRHIWRILNGRIVAKHENVCAVCAAKMPPKKKQRRTDDDPDQTKLI